MLLFNCKSMSLKGGSGRNGNIFKLHMSVCVYVSERMRRATKTNIPSEWLESQRPSRVSRIGSAENQSSFQCPHKTSADLRTEKKRNKIRQVGESLREETPSDLGLMRSCEKRPREFSPSSCVCDRERLGFCRPWEGAREQMASFLHLY